MEGLEEISNYWLKFKVDQVEYEWMVEKINKYQITDKTSVGLSIAAEKEQTLS